MEGNDCYKFTTVNNYLARTGGKPVKTVIDVGANVGTVSLLMRQYFPGSTVYAVEAVPEYYRTLAARCRHDPRIKVSNLAVCSSHLFEDDLGTVAKPAPEPLRIMKALPDAGPGWIGGSRVVPESAAAADPPGATAFAPLSDGVSAVTLDELVDTVLADARADDVDFMKMDCEGCEHSSLGAASVETLGRVRFIGGEYHDVRRFYDVMRGKLFRTHYVNLVGDGGLGSFFAERIGEVETILEPDRTDMLVPRPRLSARPIEWNVFREKYVLDEDRTSCAL